MINLEEHKNSVVHCPTEELIQKVEDQIVALGGRRLWDSTAERYLIKDKNQPNGMCFGLEDVFRGKNCYCDLAYYQREKYNILTAQQFLQMCGVEQTINDYAIY